MHAIPGDPLGELVGRLPQSVQESYYAKYGLDKPVYQQYFIYIQNLFLRGDFGESIVYPGRSVNSIIARGAPISARIGIQGLAIGISLGITLGIIAAYKRGKWMDYFVMFVALFSISIPSFVFAAVLQYFLTVRYQIFPVTGWGTFAHTVLPAMAFGLRNIGVKARFMRSTWLDVMGQDYVLAAEATGMSKFDVTFKVILRNALTPLVTIIIPELAFIFVGTFVLETIFSIPGLGTYFIAAVSARDYPMIIGQTIFISTLYVTSMLVLDFVYVLIDPRVRLIKK